MKYKKLEEISLEEVQVLSGENCESNKMEYVLLMVIWVLAKHCLVTLRHFDPIKTGNIILSKTRKIFTL